MGMKTIKVSNKLYDQVKSLADGSGVSLTEATNGVVAAGFGELKELGNELKVALTKEDLLGKKAKAAKKGKDEPKGETEVVTEVEPGEQEQGGDWLWFVGAVIAALAFIGTRGQNQRQF